MEEHFFRILRLINEDFPTGENAEYMNMNLNLCATVMLRLEKKISNLSDEVVRSVILEERPKIYKLSVGMTSRKLDIEDYNFSDENDEEDIVLGKEDDVLDIVEIQLDNDEIESNESIENINEAYYNPDKVEEEKVHREMIISIIQSSELSLLEKESLTKYWDEPFPTVLLDNFTPEGKSRIFIESFKKLSQTCNLSKINKSS